MRGRRTDGRGLLLAAAILSFALSAGCTLPLTTQTLTGGALNAGALLFVDQYNDGDFAGRGAYSYDARASAGTLAAVFEAAVRKANRTDFARSTGRDGRPPAGRPVAEDEDGVVFARSPGSRRARRDDPPATETFPKRQWTPSPRYSIRAGSPEVRGDTLTWIVTHRSSRQVAFLLVAEDEELTHVAIMPYDPPSDVFLSVPSDHAQRNAVETLHETFYFAVAERLGSGTLTSSSRTGR